MRASWKGYFRLGSLAAPVKLYSATRSAAPKTVQLHKSDHSPITRQTICLKDGEELQENDIIRAVEHKGRLINKCR